MRTKQEYQEALEKIKSRLPIKDWWYIASDKGYQKKIIIYEDKEEIDLLQELIDNLIEEKEIAKKIDDIHWQHPYKVIGNRDSYCEYNQGWSDAIDLVEQALGIDNLKENEDK